MRKTVSKDMGDIDRVTERWLEASGRVTELEKENSRLREVFEAVKEHLRCWECHGVDSFDCSSCRKTGLRWCETDFALNEIVEEVDRLENVDSSAGS